MMRDMTRKYFDEHVKPHHNKWEEEGNVSKECWTTAGELGLLATTVPEKYGGLGADILTAAIVWEEQSYSGCSGPGFAMHSDIVAPYIVRYGTEDQKHKFLPKMVSGECIGALAMTEPGAGSDVQGIKTRLEKQASGDYVLNGSKTFITNGWMAGVVVTACVTDPAAGHKGVTLALVEDGMEGFERGRKLKKLGLKAQDTSELFFNNVKIPKENILHPQGKEGMGFIQMMSDLPQERLLIADIGVARAEACFEWTRSYVKERKAFGKTIMDMQLTKQKMAQLKIEITVARTFVDRCLELHRDGRLDTAMASMCKSHCTDLEVKVADACVQLHGGYGFMWEYDVCKAYADARVQPIYGGTNEIMKEVISRDIIKD